MSQSTKKLKDPENDNYSCCTSSLVGVSSDGSIAKVIPLYCHKWTCPRCNAFRSAHWKQIAEAGQPERFITLTLRVEPARDPHYYMKILKAALPKLIRRIRSELGVCEYLLIYELTEKGTPHIHMLQRGVFIKQDWLSKTWCALTGSFIVDIRKIKRTSDIARYLTKYMGKSIANVVTTFPGQRMIQRSGSWVIPVDNLPEDSEVHNFAEVPSFTFCSMPPRELVEYLKTEMGYELDATQVGTAWTLRAPPQTDVIERILMHVSPRLLSAKLW